jgi:hypothetical protein
MVDRKIDFMDATTLLIGMHFIFTIAFNRGSFELTLKSQDQLFSIRKQFLPISH